MLRRIKTQHFASHIVEQQRLVLELPDRMSEMVGRHLGQEFVANVIMVIWASRAFC